MAKRKPFILPRFAAEKRAGESQRDKKLYGPLLPHVQWLRRRDFVVIKEKGGFRVGNKLYDAEGLVEIAQRERRLSMAPA